MSTPSGPQNAGQGAMGARPGTGTPPAPFQAPTGPHSDSGSAVREDHVCGQWHTTPRALARCHFPGALVSGTGEFAAVLSCGPVPRVRLCKTDVSVGQVLAALWIRGCGRGCTGAHRLAVIGLGLSPGVVWGSER